MHELQQLMEAKGLENDELRVQLDQSDQGRGASSQDRQSTDRHQQSVQEILWLLNQTANDVNQVGQQPQLAVDIMQKLQSINQVAGKLSQDLQNEG
jgi:hypothetical protein